MGAKAEQDYTMEKQRVVEDEKLKAFFHRPAKSPGFDTRFVACSSQIRKEFERRERGLASQSKM